MQKRFWFGLVMLLGLVILFLGAALLSSLRLGSQLRSGEGQPETQGQTDEHNGAAVTALAARRSIDLIVERIADRWLIIDVALGNYQESGSVLYRNTEYGFTFSLPESWTGYSIVTDKWEGYAVGGPRAGQVVETGPQISIRHAEWTAQHPRQDIPIMIFTLDQWNALQQQGGFSVSAAPIGPTELGRNNRYVFALPARYNYAFPTGFEEVEQILKGAPLRAQEIR